MNALLNNVGIVDTSTSTTTAMPVVATVPMAAIKAAFASVPQGGIVTAVMDAIQNDRFGAAIAASFWAIAQRAQSGGDSPMVALAMGQIALAKGRTRAKMLALSHVLGQYCPTSEKGKGKALGGLSLKGMAPAEAIETLKRVYGEIDACFPGTVAAKRAKPANYRGAYAALAAHCAANGVAVPSTKDYGF